jgi:hypothetical protein
VTVLHRVRLPVGAHALVEVGHHVEPAEVLATRRPPSGGISVPVATRLRRSARDAAELLSVRPGTTLEAGDRLASDGRGREVVVQQACLFLAYDHDDGAALVAPLGPTEPILGHVRGEVTAVSADAIEIGVAGAMVTAVGGSGEAVHGELRIGVRDADEELRASAIDVGATGRILVGGSRASAETLTRARAMGVAGIVVGGVLDKELRDFEATQRRRREVGAGQGDLVVVIVEGFGKVGFDAELFAWFRHHEGRLASVFGEDARLYVYEAGPPPGRRVLPRAGDRVIGLRRPFAGAGGELVRVLDLGHATGAGVSVRSGLVRFEDGRASIVPLANLEATERHDGR